MITYKQAVAEARRLVKRSEEDQWRLAELTWEQVEAGKSRRQWAQDIGVSEAHARFLYQVWTTSGAYDIRTRPRFVDAYAQVQGKSEDPVERTQERVVYSVRNLPPERKADVARELLAEPEIAKRIVHDDTARTNVRRALDERYEQAPKPYETRAEQAPHDHAIDVLVRLRAISAAIKAATDVILSGPQLEGADDLLAVVDWQANALNIIRTALTGRADVDAELAKILENGS